MLTNHRHLLFSLLLAALVWSPSFSATQNDDPLVLNVTVATRKGVAIRGLSIENFSVTVDKQPQKILSLSDREVPAGIGLLIDTSASQSENSNEAAKLRKKLRQGLEGFFMKSHPANEYFVLTFSTRPQLFHDWTSDYQSIVQRLDSLAFGKQTSIYDALSLGIEKVRTGRNAKHVLILISDGSDNTSKLSFKEVRDLLGASDVILYCVGLSDAAIVDSALSSEGREILKELSSRSGGRAFLMTNESPPADFNEVFELIALELRTQYQLAIVPEQPGSKRKWRELKISASRVDASGRPEKLTARTRQGYYR